MRTFIKESDVDYPKNETIYAIDRDKFEKVNLADCYGKYGQLFGHYDAQDYSIHNSASDAAAKCLDVIVKKFGERFGHGEIDTENDSYEIDEVYLSNDDIENSVLNEIEEFIANWEEENSNYEMVLAYTYWDGHNWASIIIEGDNFDDCRTHEEITDTDEVKKLNKLIKKATSKACKEGFGTKIYKHKGMVVEESYCQGNFEEFRIYPKDIVEN